MVICERCNLEMNDVASCIPEPIIHGAQEYVPLPFGAETRFGRKPATAARCHDCGVAIGGLHHEECDVEECPYCHGQRFSCDCRGDFDDEEDDEEE